jgi:hypothetical protein
MDGTQWQNCESEWLQRRMLAAQKNITGQEIYKFFSFLDQKSIEFLYLVYFKVVLLADMFEQVYLRVVSQTTTTSLFVLADFVERV